MDRQQRSQITTGVVLIGLGVVLLAKQLQWGSEWDWSRLWPFALVVIGIPQLIFGDKDGNRGGGLWLTFLGGIFLMHTYHILSLRRSWPLFIVASGVSLLLGDKKSDKKRKGA